MIIRPNDPHIFQLHIIVCKIQLSFKTSRRRQPLSRLAPKSKLTAFEWLTTIWYCICRPVQLHELLLTGKNSPFLQKAFLTSSKHVLPSRSLLTTGKEVPACLVHTVVLPALFKNGPRPARDLCQYKIARNVTAGRTTYLAESARWKFAVPVLDFVFWQKNAEIR